jgi:hypothetical protein
MYLTILRAHPFVHPPAPPQLLPARLDVNATDGREVVHVRLLTIAL